MGGDIYTKKVDTWDDYPPECKRCQEERLGHPVENYNWQVCELEDCPSYCPWSETYKEKDE